MKNSVIKKSLLITTGIGLLVMAYCIGAGFIPVAYGFQPEERDVAAAGMSLTPTVECRLVGTHTIEYVEETITETEYIDVIKSVPVKLCNFSNIQELEQWLSDENSLTTVYFQQGDTIIDCDDYALEMQQKALEGGYIMSFEIINGSEYNELFDIPIPSGQSLHAINLAIIGNDVYYIEPQTGEIVHAACLD